ncbi:hypothetical protein COLO4_21670 [Corchorus olitorius]|uniref:Uncharacterized protein n=1 Tax=Corchorus olitorius TaxID=93759 RepID=A0A1R3IRT6_9ROSI|nr:hypothetical protein COLO4_21670 [Corchorus olitorius]
MSARDSSVDFDGARVAQNELEILRHSEAGGQCSVVARVLFFGVLDIFKLFM